MKHKYICFALSLGLLSSLGCAKRDACDAALSTWQQADTAKFRHVSDNDYAAAATTLRSLESQLASAAAIDSIITRFIF